MKEGFPEFSVRQSIGLRRGMKSPLISGPMLVSFMLESSSPFRLSTAMQPSELSPLNQNSEANNLPSDIDSAVGPNLPLNWKKGLKQCVPCSLQQKRRMRLQPVSLTKRIRQFSVKVRPVGQARQRRASGLTTRSSRSIQKRLPFGAPAEVQPSGPLSVKSRVSGEQATALPSAKYGVGAEERECLVLFNELLCARLLAPWLFEDALGSRVCDIEILAGAVESAGAGVAAVLKLDFPIAVETGEQVSVLRDEEEAVLVLEGREHGGGAFKQFFRVVQGYHIIFGCTIYCRPPLLQSIIQSVIHWVCSPCARGVPNTPVIRMRCTPWLGSSTMQGRLPRTVGPMSVLLIRSRIVPCASLMRMSLVQNSTIEAVPSLLSRATAQSSFVRRAAHTSNSWVSFLTRRARNPGSPRGSWLIAITSSLPKIFRVASFTLAMSQPMTSGALSRAQRAKWDWCSIEFMPGFPTWSMSGLDQAQGAARLCCPTCSSRCLMKLGQLSQKSPLQKLVKLFAILRTELLPMSRTRLPRPLVIEQNMGLPDLFRAVDIREQRSRQEQPPSPPQSSYFRKSTPHQAYLAASWVSKLREPALPAQVEVPLELQMPNLRDLL